MMYSIRYFLVVLLTMLLQPMICTAQKTGLVLSGGGVRGMAHIGVIKALEENGIPIDFITGTSAGAIVGSFYSIGLSPSQIETLVMSEEFREWATGQINEDLDYYFKKPEPDASWVTLKFSLDSLLRTRIPSSVVNSARSDFALMENMSAAIAKAGYNFDSLFVPFRCVSSDIKSKKLKVFKDGDLPMAVRASMAYPFYFTPVAFDNMILFDGGIYNNFPVDIMLEDFNPDIMIGVNTGSYPDIPYEENLLSMFKTMLVQSTTYSVPRDSDIMIAPSVKDIGLFNFDEMKAAIDSGYQSTIRQMDAIKSRISSRVSLEDLNTKRSNFRKGFNEIYIDKVNSTGINHKQEQYIRKIINHDNQCMSIEDIRPHYFQLLTDKNIKSIFPLLKYNEATGYFDMDLLIKKERDLIVDFGGNISSSPINQAFVGLQYNVWGKQSLNIYGNIYFGKLYNSAAVRLRYDIPGKLNYYVEPVAILNRFDYFKSSSAFLEDVKPAFLIQSDRFYGANFGIPARNKGKVIASAGNFNLINNYYQTRDFSSEDISDRTEFGGWMAALQFERNTMNKKMYALKGTFINITGRLVTGKEETTPGSTGLITDTINNSHEWLQLRMFYDNYFKSAGAFTFGFTSDMFLSSQPFFANYTATILSAQGFQPTAQSKTIFLDNYRAHNYIGMGLKTIVSFRSNLELRLEGYVFQPFQAIIQNNQLKAKYDNAFQSRSLLATMTGIYNSPVGPVSLSLNYYEKRNKPLSVLFHFGYIIFNRRALD
ncbi:MAG: patatin-like phospholipase family protein [Bacteroidetes bacterium]|nr:patatin-like phospholipase family protein [Bacteroidota bacterium]